MKILSCAIAAAAFVLLVFAPSARAFQKDPGPRKDCRECHSMTVEEAKKILGQGADNVVAVLPAPIPGLWEVDVQKGGQTFPVYLDYSGKYLFNGQVIRMSDRMNLSAERYTDLNRVDVSTISLADAIVIGKPGAKRKVIVFDDPDCPWCKKLHGEIKQIVARDPEVSFHILVYARSNNPQTVKKALAIVCGKPNSAKLLDDAFAGKPLPDPTCDSKAVEETASLAAKLGVRGTPAMILPDGRLISGYMPADRLLGLIRQEK